MAIKKDQFVITNSKTCRLIVSNLIILLHLGVALKWVLEQWLNPVNPYPPIWKFVFIYYCITLFTACVLFVIHFSLLKKETISLLNSGIHVEQTVNSKGELVRYEKVITAKDTIDYVKPVSSS